MHSQDLSQACHFKYSESLFIASDFIESLSLCPICSNGQDEDSVLKFEFGWLFNDTGVPNGVKLFDGTHIRLLMSLSLEAFSEITPPRCINSLPGSAYSHQFGLYLCINASIKVRQLGVKETSLPPKIY